MLSWNGNDASGDVIYLHLLFLLRENYMALYERIKLYLLNRLTMVVILIRRG